MNDTLTRITALLVLCGVTVYGLHVWGTVQDARADAYAKAAAAQANQKQGLLGTLLGALG
jgi:hypothetical protein